MAPGCTSLESSGIPKLMWTVLVTSESFRSIQLLLRLLKATNREDRLLSGLEDPCAVPSPQCKQQVLNLDLWSPKDLLFKEKDVKPNVGFSKVTRLFCIWSCSLRC